ncbi:MAG: type II toxin-antitoxin system VapC family toxin [Candidatus Acidiferrales bacterium]
MIFVDSNIPMYQVGGQHPHKADAQRLLERLVSDRERLVTDAEVLQEILHRYAAIDRRDAIQPTFDALLRIVDEVFPVDLSAAEKAKTILLGHPRLSSRDALHLAIMEQQGVERILSFDAGLDGFPGITRLA